ncbi:MAG: hypothetical protein Q7U70_05185 [Methylotenera sp.]|nr:hypothetical protein [Methylotenera sp.]MDO9389160.1 hypothetical protein [Methylotenera sp.]
MKKTSLVATLVTEQIRFTGKKQLEIAEAAGFDNANVITMIKQGRTKLPLGKVGLMAKALELDPTYLLKLCIEEYQPETWDAIRPYMDEIVTADELSIVLSIRNAIGVPYISALNMNQRNKLDDFIQTMKKRSINNPIN